MSAITVSVVVRVPRAKAWEIFTTPSHITKWNFASPDWECPRAENDLRVGGRFTARMQAKDATAGFDFSGVYSEVVLHERFVYAMDDERRVAVTFADATEGTLVTKTFDLEHENGEELQRAGWQSILESYKRYAEALT